MNEYQSQFSLVEQNAVSPNASEPARKVSAAKIKPVVLMVGMHLTKTRGGITTLIAEILKSSLKDEFEFVYIESQAEDFGKFRKASLAARAIGQFVRHCLFKSGDLVYVHLGSNASLYRESVFIFLAKVFGKKVLAHFHAGDIDDYYPFQSRLGQKFIRSAINSSDTVIAVSRESARQLRNITGSTNIRVVPNAIDTSIFYRNDSSEIRQNTGAIKLLFVGAVGKLKGERDLIEALAILRKSGRYDVKVSILGYGAESLKSFCEEAGVIDFIEYLGAVSMNERVGFFQAADIFVLPTYAEAMPMSVIEAMAAGLPVISTTVGGIPELIEDGTDGLLIAPGDVNALAEKIAFLLDNQDVRIKIGEKARRRAVEEMDFLQYADKLRGELLAACPVKK